jgi:hypothetical protein
MLSMLGLCVGLPLWAIIVNVVMVSMGISRSSPPPLVVLAKRLTQVGLALGTVWIVLFGGLAASVRGSSLGNAYWTYLSCGVAVVPLLVIPNLIRRIRRQSEAGTDAKDE